MITVQKKCSHGKKAATKIVLINILVLQDSKSNTWIHTLWHFHTQLSVKSILYTLNHLKLYIKSWYSKKTTKNCILDYQMYVYLDSILCAKYALALTTHNRRETKIL